MRTWKLASTRLECGRDLDCTIAQGAPYLELTGRWGTRPFVRCALHAGEPVPATIERAQVPSKPVRTSPAKPLRWMATQTERRLQRMTVRGDFDAKARQAGECE